MVGVSDSGHVPQSKLFFGGGGLSSPRLVTLVVRLVHVVEEHLEASTEGNIVPSESEYVPVQAAAVGSGK